MLATSCGVEPDILVLPTGFTDARPIYGHLFGVKHHGILSVAKAAALGLTVSAASVEAHEETYAWFRESPLVDGPDRLSDPAGARATTSAWRPRSPPPCGPVMESPASPRPSSARRSRPDSADPRSGSSEQWAAVEAYLDGRGPDPWPRAGSGSTAGGVGADTLQAWLADDVAVAAPLMGAFTSHDTSIEHAVVIVPTGDASRLAGG